MGDLPFAAVRHRPDFERSWHIIQRVVEIAVIAVVLLALAGLLGTGPLSSRSARMTGVPITVTYERITRRTLQSEIILRTSEPLDASELNVEMPTDFVSKFDVVSTSPRSSRMETGPRGVRYTFDFQEEREGEVRLAVKPRAAGVINSSLRAAAGSVSLRQLVLP